MAAMAPRQFLRPPLPKALTDVLTGRGRPVPVVTKLRFDATRAQGINGAFEIAGVWAWDARDPKVGVSGNAVRGGNTTVKLPLRLRSRDLRDKVTVEVLQGKTVKAATQATAAQLEGPTGVELPVTLELFRKPNALASAAYTVRMTDADGFTAERSLTWLEKEPPGDPCHAAKPSSKCPVTRRSDPEV
jgi:hypothetical protein